MRYPINEQTQPHKVAQDPGSGRLQRGRDSEIAAQDALVERFRRDGLRLGRADPQTYFWLRNVLVQLGRLHEPTAAEIARARAEIRLHDEARTLDVYENVVIGQFLFGLGVKMGSRNSDATSVSLFQQTPSDASVGDVLVKNPGVVRVIEFKRQRADATSKKKETAKLAALQRAKKVPRLGTS